MMIFLVLRPAAALEVACTTTRIVHGLHAATARAGPAPPLQRRCAKALLARTSAGGSGAGMAFSGRQGHKKIIR